MAKVILKPIDNDHKPVELTEGKTILGRGPLLGCSDKKVSRNHAVLEINAEGEIFLTPTHVNPCFYRTKADASPKMMKKDKALRLEPGDVFSLLPLTFQYQILLPTDDTTKESSAEAEVSKEAVTQEKSPIEESLKTKEDENPEDATVVQPPTKESLKTGLNENGKPDQEDDDIEAPEEDIANEEELDTPKPKRRTNQLTTSSPRGRKRGGGASSAAVSSQEQPRKKRSLPIWLIKSASLQQDKNEDNGETVQIEDRSKRRGRKSQSEGGSVSRSARKNRQTIQRISLEDFEVSGEEDWNSADSGEGGGGRGGSGRGGSAPKRRRRKAAADDSSGSDWEAEHKNQGRGGRDAARDASSGSDWEATSNTRRSGRRGTRRRAAAVGDSDSGSDWETDRRKKTPVQKKPRGRRSRKKHDEDEEDENEELDNASDAAPSPEKEEDKEATPSKKEGQAQERKSCHFGRKCYRKNAKHLEGFSHPGDSDYESPAEECSEEKASSSVKKGKDTKDKDEKENEESTDQKPECPYGTECYRKNAQHRKDFQHTKKVRPKREASKAAAKKAKTGKEDGNEDKDIPYDLSDEESNEYKPDNSEEK